MDDPFQTPDGFAWTWPMFGIVEKTTGTIYSLAGDGLFLVPVFSDGDAAETFIRNAKVNAGAMQYALVELHHPGEMMAWLRLWLARFPPDAVVALDLISTEQAGFTGWRVGDLIAYLAVRPDAAE